MAVDWLTFGMSLFGGAGGALLLDLWWKPRYAKKRAAVLLWAEIQKNRDLIEDRLPSIDGRTRIWRDFILPRIALDATIVDLGHFPVPLAQAVVCLYHDYARILRTYDLQVEAFNNTIGPGEPDERLTKNFEQSSLALLQVRMRTSRMNLSTASGAAPAASLFLAKCCHPSRVCIARPPQTRQCRLDARRRT